MLGCSLLLSLTLPFCLMPHIWEVVKKTQVCLFTHLWEIKKKKNRVPAHSHAGMPMTAPPTNQNKSPYPLKLFSDTLEKPALLSPESLIM